MFCTCMLKAGGLVGSFYPSKFDAIRWPLRHYRKYSGIMYSHFLLMNYPLYNLTASTPLLSGCLHLTYRRLFQRCLPLPGRQLFSVASTPGENLFPLKASIILPVVIPPSKLARFMPEHSSNSPILHSLLQKHHHHQPCEIRV
jgi:hypothetical protein